MVKEKDKPKVFLLSAGFGFLILSWLFNGRLGAFVHASMPMLAKDGRDELFKNGFRPMVEASVPMIIEGFIIFMVCYLVARTALWKQLYEKLMAEITKGQAVVQTEVKKKNYSSDQLAQAIKKLDLALSDTIKRIDKMEPVVFPPPPTPEELLERERQEKEKLAEQLKALQERMGTPV